MTKIRNTLMHFPAFVKKESWSQVKKRKKRSHHSGQAAKTLYFQTKQMKIWTSCMFLSIQLCCCHKNQYSSFIQLESNISQMTDVLLPVVACEGFAK